MTLALFAAAGRGARLVGRPHSPVAHLYAGPLTTSGRHVPLRRKPACGTRTRRLSVLDYPQALEADARRVCARCRSRLSTPHAATPTGRSRDDLVAAYGHLTARQLAQHARAAGTRDDIDLVATLELIVVGAAAARRPLTGYPRATSLHDVVQRCRGRIYAAHPTAAETARADAIRARDADDIDRARRRRHADAAERKAERESQRAPHPRELAERRARAG